MFRRHSQFTIATNATIAQQSLQAAWSTCDLACDLAGQPGFGANPKFTSPLYFNRMDKTAIRFGSEVGS